MMRLAACKSWLKHTQRIVHPGRCRTATVRVLRRRGLSGRMYFLRVEVASLSAKDFAWPGRPACALGSAVGCRWSGNVGNDYGDLSRDVAARFASFGWLRRTERARLDGHAVLGFVIFAFALHLIE